MCVRKNSQHKGIDIVYTSLGKTPVHCYRFLWAILGCRTELQQFDTITLVRWDHNTQSYELSDMWQRTNTSQRLTISDDGIKQRVTVTPQRLGAVGRHHVDVETGKVVLLQTAHNRLVTWSPFLAVATRFTYKIPIFLMCFYYLFVLFYGRSTVISHHKKAKRKKCPHI